MTEPTTPTITNPAEPAGGAAPIPSAPSPEMAELTKKIDGLTIWINNQNQDNVAMKREVEQMKLERQQLEARLAENSVRPSPLDVTRQKLAKAIEEQDFAGYAQAQIELTGMVHGAQTEHLVRNQITQGFQLAARDSDMTPEAKEILARKLFIDGDVRKGPKPLRMQEVASGGSLDEYVDEAKREARGIRVDKGDYEITVGDKKIPIREVLSSYVATEEEKKKQIAAQTPVTGGTGSPSPPSPIDEKQAFIDTLEKNAKILRGEIQPE